MRWDNLRLDDQQAVDGDTLFPAGRREATLPLIERGAVARTFDTPGFRGMTFYEVQARSVVNRVPESSRMSFRWTINPYRGCQHSCVYCLAGQTPILMADGRTKPLAEVRVGDDIYGTVRDGFWRRYAITTVLAHWSTVKPAYRVTLEDGTRLVCSGDHRFLTERGWKHVIGTEWGAPLQRPFLTVNNKLMGVGGFAEPPKATAAYERGYYAALSGATGGSGPPRTRALPARPSAPSICSGWPGPIRKGWPGRLITWPARVWRAPSSPSPRSRPRARASRRSARAAVIRAGRPSG